MHFTSFDIIIYVEFISIYLHLLHGQCFYIITPMMKQFYAGIKQPLAVGQTRLRVSFARRKIHRNYMVVHWNVGITVKIFLIYISNVVLSHILITLAGCGSPVDTPALQRAICISFIYLQVASTVYLITNVFFFIFILFTVMLKLISKRANFALIPGNVKETWRQQLLYAEDNMTSLLARYV